MWLPKAAVAMMHIRDQPPPLPPDVPPAVRALIEATLAKDPRQRYGTGAELATAVAAVRAGRRLPRPRPQRRGGVRVAVALLGVFTLMLGGYLPRGSTLELTCRRGK
jgi:serine/threonine-protein kinase